MAIFDYNSKKEKLMNKWGHLINEKIRKHNINLDVFLNTLMDNGEKYYGYDFVYDLCRENPKNERFVDKFIDELTEQKGIDALEKEDLIRRFARAVNRPSQRLVDTLNKPSQDLVDAINVISNQKKEADDDLSEVLPDVNEVEEDLVEENIEPEEETKTISSEEDVEPDEKQKFTTVLEPAKEDDEIKVVEPISQPENQIASDIASGKYGDPDISFDFEPDDVVLLKAKRKAPKATLMTKIKEKLNDKSFRKKVLIGVALIATVGVATAALISQMNGSVDSMSINNAISNVVSMMPVDSIAEQVPTAVDTVNTIDYSVFGEGTRVFTDAYSASEGTNPLMANEWFQHNPMGVFDVDTHEFLNITDEQLNDLSFMKELMSDGNKAILLGDGDVASGYISANDFLSGISQGKVM